MPDIGLWGQAALEILEREINLTERVHRNSSNTFAQVHDRVIIQNSNLERYEVELKECLWSSIRIQDREASRSFPEIIQCFIEPCIIGIARTLDTCILQSVYNNLNFESSHLSRLTGDSTSTIAQANRLLDNRAVSRTNRSLIIDPPVEAELLRYCGNVPCAGYFGFSPVLYYPTTDTSIPDGISFAWHQDAITLVTRPIWDGRETHDAPTGNLFSIACNDHLVLRVDMRYDVQRVEVEVKFNILASIIILNPQAIVIFDGQN